MLNPLETYQKNFQEFTKLLEEQNKKIHRIGLIRLWLFAVSVLLTIGLYWSQHRIYSFICLGIGIALFIGLVFKSGELEKKRNMTQQLCRINEASINRLGGKWKQFEDSGGDFINYEHPFSQDLDLFGQGSLYQWTNVARTFFGRKQFAQILNTPILDEAIILERQRAILELSKHLEWRQKFQAEAQGIKDSSHEIEGLITWAGEHYKSYVHRWVNIVVYALPIVTIGMLFCATYLKVVSVYVPVIGFLLQALLLKWQKKTHVNALDTIYDHKKTLSVYEQMLKSFEAYPFETKLLQDLKEGLKSKDGHTASKQIKALHAIADGISNRMNAVYILWNIITLWDFHLMRRLEKWKLDSGEQLILWLKTLGEIEAFNGLAVIAYDGTTWCMPTFKKAYGLEGIQLGHPLLGAGRKCNDLTLMKVTSLLITGSNMSGKSTLLRTIGINMVLAYAGAPVCAAQMRCGLMSIYTSMRIKDDLERSISSFYAELLRIKQMVAASKASESVFFLLDEVFKGTNSKDRHIGAKVLMTQLNRQGATGLVSTHDLELGAMADDAASTVTNFHFREYYEGEQIYFDYVLRPGLSTTQNALYLIKMAGIDIE